MLNSITTARIAHRYFAVFNAVSGIVFFLFVENPILRLFALVFIFIPVAACQFVLFGLYLLGERSERFYRRAFRINLVIITITYLVIPITVMAFVAYLVLTRSFDN